MTDPRPPTTADVPTAGYDFCERCRRYHRPFTDADLHAVVSESSNRLTEAIDRRILADMEAHVRRG